MGSREMEAFTNEGWVVMPRLEDRVQLIPSSAPSMTLSTSTGPIKIKKGTNWKLGLGLAGLGTLGTLGAKGNAFEDSEDDNKHKSLLY